MKSWIQNGGVKSTT